jgi:hypothetical protein
MSADSNSGNKSFWPVKSALKEKIVVLYDALLSVCLSSLIFFLKSNIDFHLG